MKHKIGMKGLRQAKKWKPETKINWALQRASFFKKYSVTIYNWWQ